MQQAGHQAAFKNIIYDSFPFQATASSTDNILHVRGFHIDQITKVVSPGWNWISAPDLAPELAGAAQTLVWEDSCLKISQELYASPINGTVCKSYEKHWSLSASFTDGRDAASPRNRHSSLGSPLELLWPNSVTIPSMIHRVISRICHVLEAYEQGLRGIWAALEIVIT